MKNLGLQIYTCRDFMHTEEDIRYTFERVRKAGYTQIQTAGCEIPYEKYGQLAKEAGLMAMETRYPLFSPEETQQADMLVEEFSLLPSGGSDYHGERKPDIHLGTGKGDLAIPLSYYENLKAAAQEA